MEKTIGDWKISIRHRALLTSVITPSKKVAEIDLFHLKGGGAYKIALSEQEFDDFAKFLSENSLELLTPIFQGFTEPAAAPVLRAVIKAYQATLIYKLNPNHPGMFFELSNSLVKIDGFNESGAILCQRPLPIQIHPESPIYIIY